MGKGVIKENLSEGRYKIEYRYNGATITARRASIDQELADNDQQRVETQAARDAAIAQLRVLNTALNGVLSSTTLTPAEKDKQAKDIVTQQRDQRLVILGLQSTLGTVAATRTSLLLEDARLSKIPLTKDRTVWSADYSPDLGIAGIEVGTIEVPGEEQEVLLYPAKNQFRPWTPTIDGDMTPVAAQHPMAWLYNTCVVTGWQTYRPTYRFAKVLEILNADRMKVEIIDPVKSTYGDVDITPKNADQTKPLYTEVLCDYLDCNTQAFTVGDEVVVQYEQQNPDKPKVIGFRHDPQPCWSKNIYSAEGDKLRRAAQGEAWVQSTNASQRGCGNMGWEGEHQAVSWNGYSGRYFGYAGDYEEMGPVFWHKGQAIAAPGMVIGACIVEDTFYVVAVQSGDPLSFIPVTQSLWYRPLRGTTTWVHIGEWSQVYSYRLDPYAVLFSRAGRKGASFTNGFVAGEFAIAEVTIALTVTAQATLTAVIMIGELRPETTVTGGSSTVNTCGTPRHDCTITTTLDETETTLIAVDFVGETLVHLWLVFHRWSTSYESYGSQITDSQASNLVTPWPLASQSSSSSGGATRVIRCPELHYEHELSSNAHSGSSSWAGDTIHDVDSGKEIYEVGYYFPAHLHSVSSGEQSDSTTHTALAYLNVAGGTDAIVEVFHANNYSAYRTTFYEAGRGVRTSYGEGLDAGAGTVSAGFSGSEQVFFKGGTQQVAVGAPWSFSVDTSDGEYSYSGETWARMERVINGAPTRGPRSHTAVLGQSAVHSSAYMHTTVAIPPLPPGHMHSNTQRYLPHGVG